ncbi:MAG: L,D-transpeptidase family protein [Devosiaceae bacterium]|nr:L,D-transpeptidase family protein [Devosiaceae bacterium MH13]
MTFRFQTFRLRAARGFLLSSVAAIAFAAFSQTAGAQSLPADLECQIEPACVAAFQDALASLNTGSSGGTVAADDEAALPVADLAEPAVANANVQPSAANVQAAEAVAAPVVDEAAIAARDARMLDTLTGQVIRSLIEAGLQNDGETTSAERDAVEAFYADRNFESLFVAAGALTDLGLSTLNTFRTADVYGLNPADFEHAAFLEPATATPSAAEAAQADIAMALWTVRYARHAMTGRVNPSAIGRDITLERNFVDAATVLPSMLVADDPTQALLDYHPPHAQFHALRERLAELRDASEAEQYQPIAEGGTLRLGDRDTRVPQLRERLGVPAPAATNELGAYQPEGDAEIILASSATPLPAEETEQAAADPLVFDEALDVAVRQFQGEHNLSTDGIVGPATFAALNEKAGDLVPHLIANMERWRWMPRELGEFHVLANVPEYRLWVMSEGESIFTTRTVVGKNQHRTAIFSDEMEYIAVNPYWNVPSSITRSELLPRILQDPGYLPARNYEVVSGGRVIDPYAVNWAAVAEGAGAPRIRQRPGPRNALGEIKFMFPNQHAIYFHDTPSRGLFGRDRRAFSHGCVRVQDPWAFAEALMTNEPGWDGARLRSLQGPRERNKILDRRIPVHITYFTARIDDDGDLIMARDLYGHHGRTLAALGLDG